MIADFRFEAMPGKDCIAIRLLWQGATRAALVEIPSDLLDPMDHYRLPKMPEPMAIGGALAYGLFLSLNSGRKLRLTGDSSVWDEHWGRIRPVH